MKNVTRYLSFSSKLKWQGALFLALLLTFLLALPAVTMAAKGGEPGSPGEEGAGNQLSLPAITDEVQSAVSAFWAVPGDAGLGVEYSYGCEGTETSGNFSYPNTSCVDDLMAPTVHYSAEECVATGYDPARPCEGLTAGELSRIYWQKVGPYWSADEEPLALETDGKAYVSYVDWGDALEAVSWTERSRVRVETQPYSSRIPMFDPTVESCEEASEFDQGDPEVDCKVGFQMWHVSGQGITEHWGVRANEAAVSYNYDSPFQIIKIGSAMLNLTKLAPEGAEDGIECPMPGEGDEVPGPPVVETWNGNAWEGTCTWRNEPYGSEVSVGGKYVFGYNWPMKDVKELCGEDWKKTGWWRLTFYTTDDAVQFWDELAPTTAPPTVLAYPRDLPRDGEFNPAPPPVVVTAAEEEEEDDSEALYTPVIVGNQSYNLSYLDICIRTKEKGGGGGNGGGGGTGGGKPSDTPGSGGGGGQGGDNFASGGGGGQQGGGKR